MNTNLRSPGRKAAFGFCLACVLGLPVQALAGMDAPGSLVLEFGIMEAAECHDFPTWSVDLVSLEGPAYFSSDASCFGEHGVFVWTDFSFELEGEARQGILLLDLDLTRAPLDGVTPMPSSAVRAEYIEKSGDKLWFLGEVMVGSVWIVDVFFHADDQGALEGDLAFVFGDTKHPESECRALVQGRFSTSPSPATIKASYGVASIEPNRDVYVSTGCSGDVYIASDTGEGCDCGGEGDGGGGCEGDESGSYNSQGGCSGCEGDGVGSSESGGGSSCEGDGSSSSEGCADGDCATRVSRTQKGARLGIKGFMRLLPELFGVLFIMFYKRKLKKP